MNTQSEKKEKKTTASEKRAYARGYSQAYNDCLKEVCLHDRIVLDILVGSKSLIQLLDTKQIL